MTPISQSSIPLSDVINSLPVGILAIDLDGLVLGANHELATLVNVPSRNLIGMALQDIWPASTEEVLTAIRSGRQAMGLKIAELADCFIQARPLSGRSQGALITVMDPRLWSPLMGGGIPHDPLTPYYKKIFESSTDGISISDSEGRLLLVNEASAGHLGVKPGDIQGRHVSHLVEHNLSNGFISLDVIRSRQPVTRLIKHYRTGKHVLLTGRPIFGPDGQVHLVVINERDLTQLLKLQTSLKQHKEVIDRFKDELQALQLAELNSNEIVAKSLSMARTVETATKLAGHVSVQVVLVTGESGTGKGLLAKLMHSRSPRAKEPFIHINCAALPEALLEAELFGYEKGAFTGAAPEGRAGLFEMAGNGTVFLDEIGEMPLSLQAKLLTFLDNRQFRRIGGHQAITAGCGLIAATNQNLEELVERKQFRQDLYYRLKVFVLHIPPLRERPEDMLELARREVEKLNHKRGLKAELDPQALETLINYSFPGNVRELLNCLQQAMFLSDEANLGPFLNTLLAAPNQAHLKVTPAQALTPKNENRSGHLSDDLARTERERLLEALSLCRNTREMAAYLGISQAGVSRKLKRYQLSSPTALNGKQ